MNEDALTKRGYAYEILDGEEVNITVKGKSSIVRSMGISDFQAIADFSKLSKVDAVPIDVTAKKYSDQLDITLGTTNTMKIKKYRKKPVVIEAYQTDKVLTIHTLEGDMIASKGDYIITGVDGEQYPCKPDIFEKTYEPVED